MSDSDAEPDTTFDQTNDSFQFSSLNEYDRQHLVTLTTSQGGAYLQADTLELSALGANVDVHGNWNAPSLSNIIAWHEQGSYGRTTRNLIVQRGYLFPLGHKAVLNTLILRTVAHAPKNAASDPYNYPVAYLQVQTTIQVTETVKMYPAPGQPFAEAQGTTDWPFQKVQMITTTSPLIDSPTASSAN